jgi:hypothetical protein
MKVKKLELIEKPLVRIHYDNGQVEIKTARPLLMQPWGVLATLEGRKTQTRRIIVPQPIHKGNGIIEEPGTLKTALDWIEWKKKNYDEIEDIMQYYPGDLFYIREPYFDWGYWRYTKYKKIWEGQKKYRYIEEEKYYPPNHNGKCIWRKRPSLHMPREAARVWIILDRVRVERVQDITEEDAINEGAPWEAYNISGYDVFSWFQETWDSINANRKDKEGRILPYSWKDNPFVWPLDYRLFFQGRGEVAA